MEDKNFARISRSEIVSNVNKWSNTLIGYVVGNKPFYMQLKGCVNHKWKPTCSLEIHSRVNDFVFFKFGDEGECNHILQSGPWLFDGRLIVLKKWNEEVGLERDFLSSVPVWIRFPGLHLKLWSKEIISRIASLIRTPIHMDKATSLIFSGVSNTFSNLMSIHVTFSKRFYRY